MLKKTKEVLNFDEIIHNVQDELMFPISKDYWDIHFKIHTDFEKVQSQHQFLMALHQYDMMYDLPLMQQLALQTKTLEKIKIQQLLESAEYLALVHLFENINLLIQTFLTSKKKYQEQDIIAGFFGTYFIRPEIRKKITTIFDEQGEIKDNASNVLYRLRQESKRLEKHIRRSLEEIMEKSRDKMSERLFTLRNNRYVLPIKNEFKNTFKGILHDQSASKTTAYIEPAVLVKLNNELQQNRLEQEEEITRILGELNVFLFPYLSEMKQNLYVLTKYDIMIAKLKYAVKNEHHPIVIINDSYIELYQAKHPLLSKNVVGNDIFIGKNYDMLLITGANTGGKSVFLKTIGLMVLMAQAGMFLPVNNHYENKIGIYKQLFVDIGDQQSLMDHLSTFSGHILNIKEIIENIRVTSLVLLDELGNGTDPGQGAALSIAILEALHHLKAQVIATTHFPELKEFATVTDYTYNAAMLFDEKTLQPTYRLLYGSYGASYAFDIAKKLSLDENIVKKAEEIYKTYDNQAQELLVAYEKKLKETDQLSQDIQKKEQEINEILNKTIQNQSKIKQQLMQEKQKMLKQYEDEWEGKINEINKLFESLKEKKQLKSNEEAQFKGLLNQLTKEEVNGDLPTSVLREKVQNFQIGQRVYVPKLQAYGDLVKKKQGQWQVKVGMLTSLMDEKNLVAIVQQNEKKEKKKMQKQKMIKKSVTYQSFEVDLRGMRAYEALEKLEQYFGNIRGTHENVRIIHGHGTGSLRMAVQEFLKKHPYVADYRYGGEGEGGVGVTIVQIK